MNRHAQEEWFDNETFWRETFPLVFSEKRFVVADETVENVLKLAKPPGTSALDLCCSPGRCSIALRFGCFEDRNDDLCVLANVYRSLKPGGAVLMDLMGKEISPGHLSRLTRTHCRMVRHSWRSIRSLTIGTVATAS